MLLELKGICKQYGIGEGAVSALKNINFTVQEGEFVAIMGKSGCGKTTLLNIIGTLLRPDAGNYVFDGECVNDFTEQQLAICKRRKIALIFQNYNLLEELSIQNNIILPYIFDKRSFDENELAALANKLNIEHILKKYPSQLSGGEKQRAAIARALLVHPRVILADEPTGNLDYENAIRVMELLKACAEEYHQTVVMVTHDEEMAKYANRLVTMKDGCISDAGATPVSKPAGKS